MLIHLLLNRCSEAGADQSAANVSDDGAFQSPPESVQAEIASDTNKSQAEKEDYDLNKANYRAAVPAKVGWFGAHGKNEQADKSDDEAQSNPRGEGVFSCRERAGGNRGGC